MWDNLCILREALYHKKETGCSFVALDQKKAFDLVSRDYLWSTMKHFGFPTDFIGMIKCMYVQTVCQVNINGHLTGKIDIKRGVKQGCPLSSALYVIAISPLLKTIKNDVRLEGIHIVEEDKTVISAYADDVTVFIRSQQDLDIVKEHFKNYELVSGASLNHAKSEVVWIGNPTAQPPLDIEVKEEIKILGLIVSNGDPSQINWQNKEKEIKE